MKREPPEETSPNPARRPAGHAPVRAGAQHRSPGPSPGLGAGARRQECAWSRCPRLTPTCGRACGGAAPPGLWKLARGRVVARRRWREGSELLVVFRDSSDFAARFFLNLVALDVGVAEGKGEVVAERSEGCRQELL